MVLLCLVGLTAWRYPTTLKMPATLVAPTYAFKDERPPQQLKSGFESLMITNCAYGSLRVGSRDIAPDLAVLLTTALSEKLPHELDGREVVLKNFTVHLNNAAGLRQDVGSMYSGLIPGLMNDRKKVGCAADDVRGGYVAGEVEQGKVPLIVAIDVWIDGQPVHARAIAPFDLAYPPMAKAKPEIREQWNVAADGAVTAALAQLVERVSQHLSSAPAPLVPAADPARGGTEVTP